MGGGKVRAGVVKPETWIIHGGRPDRPGDPLNTPMAPASAYLHAGYSRDDSAPGWQAFEQVMGGLEGGEAVAFASGMAACAAVLATVPAGGHIVMGDDLYMGVANLAEAGDWEIERLPVTDPRWLEKPAEADMVWIESPSNPLLEVADVAGICAAPRKGRVVVDNTFLTPLVQRPLALGADVSVTSATKLVGGHTDLLMGVAATRDPELLEALRHARGLSGATPGTLEVFLALRGARTLPLRLERASANAAELARRLEPLCTRVRYPGVGTVVSFEVADAAGVCERVRIIRHATSLGGVETTLERRAQYPGQEHVPDDLIRVSVGCENVDDLWEDLRSAISDPGGRL
jgi:cystathionine gamma-synthase